MQYPNPAEAAPIFPERLKGRTWFVFPEVAIETPKPL